MDARKPPPLGGGGIAPLLLDFSLAVTARGYTRSRARPNRTTVFSSGALGRRFPGVFACP